MRCKYCNRGDIKMSYDISIPGTLFSPFKTLFIGYVVLIALGKITVSSFWGLSPHGVFILVSIILMGAESIENHFIRPWLNNKAGNKNR